MLFIQQKHKRQVFTNIGCRREKLLVTVDSFGYWKGQAQLTLGIRASREVSHARLGQPELLLGSHQWEAFPGTLLGSSTQLSSQQHLGSPQLLWLQGSLGLLVFFRAQQ